MIFKKRKKLVSLLLTCIVVAGIQCFSISANAETVDNNVEASKEIADSNMNIVQPRTAGSIIVTAHSGANVRSGPGTNYRKVGTINWGDDAPYAYETVNGWYKIEWGNSYAWISSSVCRLS